MIIGIYGIASVGQNALTYYAKINELYTKDPGNRILKLCSSKILNISNTEIVLMTCLGVGSILLGVGLISYGSKSSSKVALF